MATFGMNCQHFQKATIILIISLLILLGLILFQQNQIPEPNFITTRDMPSKSKLWVDYTLSQAASKISQNNTLIICSVSEPFLPLLNNWLISVTKHKHQDKVLVIAEDYPTLLKVNNNWPGHAVLLSPDNQTAAAAYRFGSKGFKNLTDKRVQYLLQILELGYSVLFNDVDMVWLDDPFPYMKGEYDVYFIDDRLDVKPHYSHNLPPAKAKDGTTYICACMIYARPTSRSKILMKEWIEEIQGNRFLIKQDNDQLAFNRAINKTAGQVKLYLLPQTGFPPGGLYFSNREWAKKNQGKQVIIHNNYIVGLEEKIKRFRDYGLWFVDDHHVFESPLGKL